MAALQERVDALRDETIVMTGKSTKRTESKVDRLTASGGNVEMMATATLFQVHSLDTGMKSMGLTVEQTSSHVGSMVGHISSLTESHSDMHTKVDQLMDLEKARGDASEAIVVVLQEKIRTAECKTSRFCLGLRNSVLTTVRDVEKEQTQDPKTRGTYQQPWNGAWEDKSSSWRHGRAAGGSPGR